MFQKSNITEDLFFCLSVLSLAYKMA